MNAILQNKYIGDPDDWIINVIPQAQGFVCSTSSGTIKQYDWTQNVSTINAHESSINCLKAIDNNLVISCSTDSVKLWDLRNQQLVTTFANNNSHFLSMDNRDNLIAGGTELVGVDAELFIWDIRNPGQMVKTYVDSHHDDITDIKFHPSISQYLMSGSTDGYVNIYDLNETDEDEALHQVINYSSVHSCNFITANRISILSHMETLSIHSLNNTNYEVIEEQSMNDIGDMRTNWSNCEYVIDINPQGYASYGANSEVKLSLVPFDVHKEVFSDKLIVFPGAHGEEVVRDLKVFGNQCLSCGEDGIVRLWDLPFSLELGSGDSVIEEEPTKETKEKKEKKDKKEKKEKKEKKDKKHKKHKKDIRFKPY